MLTKLYTWMHQPDLAEETINETLTLLGEIEHPVLKAQTWLTYGNFLIATNRFDEAIEAFTTAKEFKIEKNHPETLISIQCGLARANCELGNHEKALELANEVWPKIKNNEFVGEWDWGTVTVNLVQVLEFAQDKRAEELLIHIHHVIQDEAEKIKSPKHQHGYLNQRPDIRWLVERYTQMLAST